MSDSVLHIDGDAFFVSCEVAMNPALRGRPVVTGAERGIASALSYEAKALGVKRGMPIYQVKQLVPDVVVMPGNYKAYAMFSRRMYEIVRRYTGLVEEYSIDECFADLAGIDERFNKSYLDIAWDIKRDLQSELNMTFSLGLAPNKLLAKLGSKYKKPDGLTIIQNSGLAQFLEETEVEKLWGMGPRTSGYLRAFGIKTALDFASKSKSWVWSHLSKPHQEMWRELQGESVWPVVSGHTRKFASVSRTRTFAEPSSDPKYLLMRLSRNIENACILLRRYGREAERVSFFLKTQKFKYKNVELKLVSPSNVPSVFLTLARDNFNMMYKEGELYRATGVVVTNICGVREYRQGDLFDSTNLQSKMNDVIGVVDDIAKRFGKNTVHLATSLGKNQNMLVNSSDFGIPNLGSVV